MKRSPRRPRLAAAAALATIAVAAIPATASATQMECQEARYSTGLRFLRYAEERMDVGDYSGALVFVGSAQNSFALVSRCV